jgi:hypothetical protein
MPYYASISGFTRDGRFQSTIVPRESIGAAIEEFRRLSSDGLVCWKRQLMSPTGIEIDSDSMRPQVFFEHLDRMAVIAVAEGE